MPTEDEGATELYIRLHGRHGMPDRNRAALDALDADYRAGKAKLMMEGGKVYYIMNGRKIPANG